MAGGGPHGDDAALFAPTQLGLLQRAAEELGYLRTRGYALPSALKLVGDRYQLRERQRSALTRATSAAEGAAERAARRVRAPAPPPSALWVDGFNLIITLETALRGGVLVTTLDETLRDLAGIHGAYRPSPCTARALALLAVDLQARGWAGVPVRFLLDAPVSNTGRLAALIRAQASEAGLPWEVEVVPDPDLVLRGQLPPGALVVSGDAPVLDGCGPWLDWGGELVRDAIPEAWILPLVPSPSASSPLPPRWETERYLLRPPQAADAAWIFRDYAQDPEVTRFLTWAPHRAQSETEAFLARVLSGWASTGRGPYVIEASRSGRGLGMFELRIEGPQAELGYVIARAAWGQGVMTEVVGACAERSLSGPAALTRLSALVDLENGASARVLEKCGFRREGTLRGYTCRPGACQPPRDTHVYGRVRGDLPGA